MNLSLENQIADLENKIKDWKLFLSKINEEEESVISEKAEDYHLLTWRNNQIEYYYDHAVLPSTDFYIAKKAEIIPSLKYKIPNYELKKGKNKCEKYIYSEIEKLEKALENLKINQK